MRVGPAWALALLLPVSACVQVQVDVPSLCIRQSVGTERADAGSVDAASEWVEPGVGIEVVQLLDVDLDAGLETLGVGLEGAVTDDPTAGLWLQDGRMWRDDNDTVAFVHRVSVAVLDPERPAVPVLSYDRDRDGAVSDELVVQPIVEEAPVASGAPQNLLERMVDGRLSLGVALDVDPETVPPGAVLETELCMSGVLRFEERWVTVEDR
jgi:hypothetical protein